MRYTSRSTLVTISSEISHEWLHMARDAHIKVRFPPNIKSHILKRTNHEGARGDGGYLMALVVVCMVRDSLICSSIGGKWMVGYLLGR